MFVGYEMAGGEVTEQVPLGGPSLPGFSPDRRLLSGKERAGSIQYSSQPRPPFRVYSRSGMLQAANVSIRLTLASGIASTGCKVVYS